MGYKGTTTPTSIRDLWQTPAWLFGYYHQRFNFTTDVAASWFNRFCDDHRSEKMDALNCGWGERNWCNPPYSHTAEWVDKAISEMEKGRLTVMLIPGDTAAHWYHKALAHCTEFHIIRGRISFVNALTQKAVHGNNKGSTVFVFNPKSFTKRLPVLVDKTEMQKLGAA